MSSSSVNALMGRPPWKGVEYEIAVDVTPGSSRRAAFNRSWKSVGRLGIGAVRGRDDDAGSDDTFGVQARVDGEGLGKAVDEETGAGEEHQGHRDLNHDKHTAQGADAASRGRAARAALDDLGQVGAQDMEDGDEAGQHADQESQADGEAEDAQVERRRQGLRQHLGHVEIAHAQRAPREREAEGGAERGEQQAFEQQLTRDGRAAGAEGGTDRELRLARVGAHEQEVGDVHAADEEHEGHAALQEEERGADRTDALFLHAADVHGHARAFSEGLGLRRGSLDVALLDCLGLGIRLARGHTGLEATRRAGCRHHSDPGDSPQRAARRAGARI